jgi:hypothetical protein
LNHTLNQLSFLLLRAKLTANLVAQAHDTGDFSAAPADPIFADIREVNLVKALAEVLASRPGAPDCPNPKWTEAIEDLAFTSATIVVEQPAGTAVLTVTCSFAVPTEDGAVPTSDVLCTSDGEV